MHHDELLSEMWTTEPTDAPRTDPLASGFARSPPNSHMLTMQVLIGSMVVPFGEYLLLKEIIMEPIGKDPKTGKLLHNPKPTRLRVLRSVQLRGTCKCNECLTTHSNSCNLLS